MHAAMEAPPAVTDPLILVACGSQRLAANVLAVEARVPPRHPRLRYATTPHNLYAMPRGTLLVDLIELGAGLAGTRLNDAAEMHRIIAARAYTRLRLDELATELA